MDTSRRHFLRAAGALATAPAVGSAAAPLALGLAGLGTLARHAAAAGSGPGYRALVCLFLEGGHDGHNWVVPTDSTGYGQYQRARGALALPKSDLLAMRLATSQGSGRSFGMASALAPLHALYEAGQAAVVANIGPLLRPTTLADVEAERQLPPRLYSHNDQASTWQSLSPEGARSGWGGRMGDLLMSANAQPVFTAISTSGNAVFLAGDQVQQYQVGEDGPRSIGALTSGWVHGSTTASSVLQRVLARSGTNAFERDYAALVQRSISADKSLRAGLAASGVPALPTSPITLPGGGSYTLAGDSLARRLAIVARVIGGHATMGTQRQVFMVSMGGFDTHSNQRRDEAELMARIGHAVAWFHGAMAGIGLADDVLLFTASEFGRTLVANGDGTDHGWGNHQLVVGGGVRGRNIVGSFPVTALGTATDVGSGRLLPTTAVTQLAATFGRWLGLSDSQVLDVLPGLDAFPTRTLPLI